MKKVNISNTSKLFSFVCVSACVCYGKCVEVRGQLAEDLSHQVGRGD